jgi:hypothetical protein
MFRSVLRSAIRVVVFTMLTVVLIGRILGAGLAVCPDHGVKSAFTGNKRSVFSGNKRLDYCEYTHPLSDLSDSHKFWQRCE